MTLEIKVGNDDPTCFSVDDKKSKEVTCERFQSDMEEYIKNVYKHDHEMLKVAPILRHIYRNHV
jgi:hypothetical protein